MLKICETPWAQTLREPIVPLLNKLDQFLADIPLQLPEEIRPIATYCLSHSGKRLRPIFAFYSTFEAPCQDSLVKAAAVVELIHIATLVHDDVLDNGTLRHRAPTLHVRYGADVAILMGDALFAHGLYLASSFPTTAVCQIVSQSTARLCAGEISQTLSQKNQRFDLEHYYKIIDLKTADLFSSACQLGGHLSTGLSPEDKHNLSLFGRYLGRAYQIYDDLNDILGQESCLGKTLGSDFETQKCTLPVLLYLESLSASEKLETIQSILDRSLSADTLVQKLEHSGISHQVKQQFHATIQSAESFVQDLPHKEQLLKLSQGLSHLFT
jgi:octaprenyl-diphosphate synthase